MAVQAENTVLGAYSIKAQAELLQMGCGCATHSVVDPRPNSKWLIWLEHRHFKSFQESPTTGSVTSGTFRSKADSIATFTISVASVKRSGVAS